MICFLRNAYLLRPEINISVSPSQPFYTVINRWKAFSLFFGFLAENGTGGYIWVPDNATLWANVKAPYATSNPTGKDYDNRLFKFAEFWLTRRISTVSLALALVNNSSFPNLFINRFSDFNQPEAWVINQIHESFESKFLTFVKSLAF